MNLETVWYSRTHNAWVLGTCCKTETTLYLFENCIKQLNLPSPGSLTVTPQHKKYLIKFFIHKLDASLQSTVHGQHNPCNEKNKIKTKAC